MSLAKQKESLIRDRDRLTDEVYYLNKRLLQQRIQNEALAKKSSEFEEKCHELYRLLDVCIMSFRKKKKSANESFFIAGNIDGGCQREMGIRSAQDSI